jgi:5-methylcytosine-specific restriction protein A
MTNPVYRTRQWRTIRAAVLERDQQRCQINGPRCTTTATEADHIVALMDGGAPYDPGNLRAACKTCNSSLGASAGNQQRRPSSGWA